MKGFKIFGFISGIVANANLSYLIVKNDYREFLGYYLTFNETTRDTGWYLLRCLIKIITNFDFNNLLESLRVFGVR